jgi:hypothetical protein
MTPRWGLPTRVGSTFVDRPIRDIYLTTVLAAVSSSANSERPIKWMTAGTRRRRTSRLPKTKDRASVNDGAKMADPEGNEFASYQRGSLSTTPGRTDYLD